jgi:GAF domain-containing protein
MKLFGELPRWRKYRAAVRLIILLLASMIGFWFAFLIQIERYGWAFAAALALGTLSILEFVVVDLIVESRFPRETRKFLETLQERLATTVAHEEILRHMKSCVEGFGGCDIGQISSTVHLRVSVVSPDSDGESAGLVQVSDYTRAGLGGRRWRVLQATKGIVGRCLRLDEMVWVNFRSVEEYQRRMVAEFGFTREETASHTLTGRSYLAYPILHQGITIGVLYFFSTQPQVFPRAADPTELQQSAENIFGVLRTAGIL